MWQLTSCHGLRLKGIRGTKQKVNHSLDERSRVSFETLMGGEHMSCRFDGDNGPALDNLSGVVPTILALNRYVFISLEERLESCILVSRGGTIPELGSVARILDRVGVATHCACHM